MIFTMLLGTIGGAIAFFLGFPIPWLVGSLLAMTLCKKVSLVKAPNKTFSRWMRVLLGVSLGGSIAASIHGLDASLISSLSMAVIFVLIVTLVGVWYFKRLPAFNNLDSFMSALPGGLTFLISLSGDLGERFPKIALIHTVRMVFLIFTFSIFAYLLGVENTHTSVADSFDVSMDLNLWQVFALCIGSGLLADRLKIAGGHIMFPMIISAIFYANGLIQIPMPELVNTVAMVTFGAVIGCKISTGSWSDYKSQIRASIVFTAFAISIALLMSLGLAEVLDANYFLFFLALAPGGIAEICLIALALGFDVGFVAVVHTCRYLFIMFIGAVGLNLLSESKVAEKNAKVSP